jgi:hypothetical protein
MIEQPADVADVVVASCASDQRELVAVGAGADNQPYMRDGVRFSSIFGSD